MAKKNPTKTESKNIRSLTYEQYKNDSGKTCARICGFKEGDGAYEMAAVYHASKSWRKEQDGSRTLFLCFGPIYAEAAKQLCEALNSGDEAKIKAANKTIAEALPKHRAEKQARREARKNKKMKKLKNEKPSPAEKSYTMTEIAAMMKRAMAGEDVPELAAVREALSAAA